MTASPPHVWSDPGPGNRASTVNPGGQGEPLPGTANAIPVFLFAMVTMVAMALYLTRLSMPSDLADNHQDSLTAYVLDVVHNGHWILQRDINGAIASKPPLFVWLAAVASETFGRVNHFTLSLPSALATFGLAWIIVAVGNSHFGWRAGLVGAVAYLLSSLVAKQMLLVRTDGLFSFWVAVAALAAWRAWDRGQGWTWFWLSSAMATLTKGPLGLVLAAVGLLASVWERRSGARTPIRGGHLLGVMLFMFITVGWLLLACFHEGHAVFQKLFVQELYQRAVSKGEGSLPLIGFYRPPLYFVSRFAPWSLVTLIAAWRIWRSPANSAGERRFERFLFCWFFGGLLLFSLAAHHRGDLLMPLLPAAALLAGREIGRATESWKPSKVFSAAMGAAVLFLAMLAAYTMTERNRQDGVLQTRALREMAELVSDRVGQDFPLIHVRSSAILQMHLGTCEQRVTPQRAAELLQGVDPAFVVMDDLDLLPGRSEVDARGFQVVAEVFRARRPIRIVSNHPRLEWTETMVHYSEPYLIRMKGVRALKRRQDEFRVTPAHEDAALVVINESNEPRHLSIQSLAKGASSREARLLAPKEEWPIQLGSGLE
jgi:4-amino-4-deoxy-L-arabinose transferase-like glycosyltransferase